MPSPSETTPPPLVRTLASFLSRPAAANLEDLVTELDRVAKLGHGVGEAPTGTALERVVSMSLEKQILLHLIFHPPDERTCELSRLLALLESVDARLNVRRESYDKISVLKDIASSMRYIGLEHDGDGNQTLENQGYCHLGDDSDIRELTNSLRCIGSGATVDGRTIYRSWCDSYSAGPKQRRQQFGKDTNFERFVEISQAIKLCIGFSPGSYEIC